MSALEVIERVYGHLDRGEAAELLELMAEDVTWYIPEVLPFGGVHHGRNEVARALAGTREFVYDWGTQVDDLRAVGDRVVATGHHPVATKESIMVEIPFLAVWRVEEGRVARLEEHLDTLQLLRAVGRSATG